jgi:hypothetical protein
VYRDGASVGFSDATAEVMLAPSLDIETLSNVLCCFLKIAVSAAVNLSTTFALTPRPCRCTIQLGSLYESQVLPSASCQTSAFNGRSTPAVWTLGINGGLFPGGRRSIVSRARHFNRRRSGKFLAERVWIRFDAVAGLRP